MTRELNIVYLGLKLIVRGEYSKGRGSLNYELPPEEDDFIITNIITPVKKYEDFDWRDRMDIKQICLEKLET